jgi:NAD(P)-dependent dehydrogenase (short-subunit alcohol dehydrogenase family)
MFGPQRGWYVIMACRSYSKAAVAAKKMDMDPSTYEIQTVDLASLENVRQFVNAYKATGRPLDALVCNAAVWYPQDKAPRITPDGYEEVSIYFAHARRMDEAQIPYNLHKIPHLKGKNF